jgi:predicted metalloprotease
VFVSTVLGSVNDTWENVFAQNNLTYEEPKLVLFRGSTQSSCGGAVDYVGPHYCPEDETIYLDETFFDELTTRLGAQGGDVAEAYVIAHEVGHHAQNELGIFDRAGSSNEDSIRLELQADCFAGLWAYSIKDLGVLEQNEINEAIDAARSVGDDRIQAQTTGRVNPEKWTHGSSAQRTQAFNTGFSSGNLASCEF